jgi:hypothetical protein
LLVDLGKETSYLNVNTVCTSHCWKVSRRLYHEYKDTCAGLITGRSYTPEHFRIALCNNNTVIIVVSISEVINLSACQGKGTCIKRLY